MRKFPENIFILFLILLKLNCFGQNENSKWCFGNGFGMDFMNSPPTSFTSNINTFEGCASIADAAGNLLFYTDGESVWDKLHAIMPNGNQSLAGNLSSAQTAIIIKSPGNNSNYYIFTNGIALGGLRYSIVDMSLNSGNGNVTTLNVALTASVTEHITATRHCNGVDYWVVVHEFGTPNSNFLSFLVTANGVSATPVVSPAGWIAQVGCMKISPDGKKLGAAGTASLFDFDNSTGIVSNQIVLSTLPHYGCEFSPNSNFVYMMKFAGASNYLAQWNACAGSGTAIIASMYTVSANSSMGSIQLAPDGKLYVAGFTALGIIHNPNNPGALCNYSNTNPPYLSGTGGAGLSNFAGSSFNALPSSPPFTFTVNNLITCQTASFTAPTLPIPTQVNCSMAGYSVTSLLWNFGDPSSGSANTSTLTNPTHFYNSTGTYSAQLIINYSCGGGTDTLKQVVSISSCISALSTSITCASLGSATVNMVGGVGPYSYTWTPGLQTTPVVSGLSPGTYTINVYDPGTNATYTTNITLNPLIPLTGNINNSPSVTCNGAGTATANITNLAGGSFNSTNVNYLWTNGLLSYTVPTPTNLSGGLWNVIITDNLTACQINQFIFISQPPAMTLNLASNTPSSCAGYSIVLTGANTGGTPGYTYSWTNGPGSSTNSANELVAGTYIYTLTSTDANTCSISNTISVDFIPNPTVTVSNAFICPLAVGTITASGATSYTWSDNSNGTTLSQSPLSNTQYSVVGSALGCTSSAVGNIILKPVPFPMFNNNSPLCEGTVLNFYGFGGSSYLWDGPNGFSSSTQSLTINPVTLNHSGIYNLTVTAANSCTASTTKTIVVNATPTLSANGSTVCSVQTLSLFAGSIPGATYLWNGPLSYTSSQQNPLILNPILNSSVIYTVKVTSPLNCSNSATVLTSVVSPPILNFSLSSSSLCAQALNGSPNSITLTSSGANTYTLSTPAHIGNPNPGGPVSPLITQPPINSGPATATLSGSNGVCTVTSAVVFTIIPNPSVTVSSPTPVICAGKTYTYTNQGASSYSWNIHSPGSTTYSTGSVAVTNPTINSVFSVVGGSLGCFSAIQSVSITVHPLPELNFPNNSPTVCIGSKVNLVVNGTSSSYNWSPNTGLNTTTGPTVSAGPLTQQNYTVTGSLNTCTSSAVLAVSVLPLPSPTITILKPKLCTGELVTMQAAGGEAFFWNGPSIPLSAGQTLTFVANNSLMSGNYTLTATDKNGCKASANSPLLVYDLPDGDLHSSKKNACIPFTSNFDYLKFGPDSVTAQWELNSKIYPAKFSHTFTTAGTYTIKGNFKDRQTTCSSTKNFLIEAYPLPIADFTYSPEKPVENSEEVIFTNTSQGEALKKWNWYFENNDGYRTEHKNTSFAFTDAGAYTIAMVVTNAWGCKDTVVKNLVIESDLAIYVPNVFTPNGDELNDVFLPVIRSVKKYRLSIFDRWGAMIFISSELQSGWDGSFRGEPCKVDVYIWKITLSSMNGEAKEMTGQVLLSR